MTIMIPAGGADIDNLDNRLINEASRAAGRWLHSNVSDAEARGRLTYVEANLRGTQEQFGQTEEACSVFVVQQIAVKESI